VTEAQRQRIVNNERAPIAQDLSGQAQALSQQDQTLKDALDQAGTMATNRVNDYTRGRSALQSQYDDTYKREQDSAAEAARQAAAAEEQRQFNVAQATTRGSAGYGGSAKAKTPSASETKAAVQAHVTQSLAANAGKDGYVSRATFGAALNDWQSAGGTVRDFWKSYGRYANAKTKSQYPGYAQR
jgi:hypothetical protein